LSAVSLVEVMVDHPNGCPLGSVEPPCVARHMASKGTMWQLRFSGAHRQVAVLVLASAPLLWELPRPLPRGAAYTTAII
jgi:hypothetical protein